MVSIRVISLEVNIYILITFKHSLMKTSHSKDHLEIIRQQVTDENISWIGHLPGEIASRNNGQTFLCPTAGDLDAIEIYSAVVCDKASIDLTVHRFNAPNHTWGPALATSKVEIEKQDAGHWISFPINDVSMERGLTYGFRLSSSNTLVGIGGTIGSLACMPVAGGQEWDASSDNQNGKYYSYFSLAFAIELRA